MVCPSVGRDFRGTGHRSGFSIVIRLAVFAAAAAPVLGSGQARRPQLLRGVHRKPWGTDAETLLQESSTPFEPGEVHVFPPNVTVNVVPFPPAAATAAAAAAAAANQPRVERDFSGIQMSDAAPAQVSFLFMTISGIDRPDLWNLFFTSSPENAGLYRVYMHCVWPAACEQHRGHLPGLVVVPTASSVYCDDLVSPMASLLQVAVKDSKSMADKFVFLSESTLPVKPFSEIHATLVAEPGSDFCIEPRSSWLDLTYHHKQSASLVKHGQWLVLNQMHAKLFVDRWTVAHMKLGDGWVVPLPDNYTGQGLLTTASQRSQTVEFGALPQIRICADEWFIFAALFGAIMRKGQTLENLPSLTAPELYLDGPEAERVQGVCHTFVFWDSNRVDTRPLVEELLQDSPETDINCYPRCATTHPGMFWKLSDRGAGLLRRSSYLFVRKFASGVMNHEQFTSIILAPNPPIAP